MKLYTLALLNFSASAVKVNEGINAEYSVVNN